MTYTQASAIVNSEAAFLKQLPARKIAEAIKVIRMSICSTWEDQLSADYLATH